MAALLQAIQKERDGEVVQPLKPCIKVCQACRKRVAHDTGHLKFGTFTSGVRAHGHGEIQPTK